MPRHDPLPTTPGQFDYPPASALPESSVAHSSGLLGLPDHLVSAREDPHRRRSRVRRLQAGHSRPTSDSFNIAEPTMRPRPPWAMSATRQISRSQNELGTQNSSVPAPPVSASVRPTIAPTTRTHRPVRASEYSLSRLQEEGQRLAQIDEDVRSITARPVGSTRYGVRHEVDECEGFREEGDSRRKRRKLDNAPQKTYIKFEYGYYGQIVSGKLKMELVSSDGGSYREGPLNLMYSREAENVLKDDKSVYRTKSSHCNIVIRHQGETTFSLERIVIKAPKSGFTDPVQDGLVFASLEDDAMFERTTRYQVVHFPTCHFASHFISQRNRHESDTEPGIRGLVHAPSDTFGSDARNSEVLRFNVTDEHHDCDESTWDDGQAEGEGEGESEGSADGAESDGEISNSDRDSDRLTVAEWSRTPTVTRTDSTLPSHPHDFDFEVPDIPLHWARFSQRQGRRARGDLVSRSQERDRMHEIYRDRYAEMGDAQLARQASLWIDDDGVYVPHESRQRISRMPVEFQANQNTNTRNHEELLAPVARFSMHRDRNKMSIKFDTPISAKYVLLKMWAPRDGKTIDVQSIECYGFAGPRYWPAVEMR